MAVKRAFRHRPTFIVRSSPLDADGGTLVAAAACVAAALLLYAMALLLVGPSDDDTQGRLATPVAVVHVLLPRAIAAR